MTFDAVLIAGPTASGKSDAALALAEAIGGVIINADSMQVYAEAPILTAQPTASARTRVPHLLYGHVSVQEVYSVGRWRQDATTALGAARAMGLVPIFAGGTGLYFTALTQGLAEVPPIPPALRARGRALLEKIGVAALHEELARKDPKTASRLKPTDPQRTLRAYEVFEATGRPLADWQEQGAAPVLEGMRLARFVLDLPRPELRARIATRFEAMVENGGLAEALGLKDLDPALPAAKLLGLRPLIALGEGRQSQGEAVLEAVTATRQFAKRQMTWFRHRMADYVWFNAFESNIVTQYEQYDA
jgi:tRNA dimethylallyltransferase